jgi:hypothetical protein
MPKPLPISPEEIEQLSKPSPTRIQRNDGACPGLSLRAGLESPTWIVRGTTGGVLRKVIGDPRTMPIEIARKIAVEAKARHASGNKVDDDWVLDAQKRHGMVTPAPVEYVEPPGPWTWGQAAEAHLRWMLERKGRSPVTVAANRKGLLRTLAEFRDVFITDITLEDVQDEIDRVHLAYPALAVQAVKAARPFSRWWSIGPQRLKSGTEEHVLEDLVVPETTRHRSGSDYSNINPVHIYSVARTVAICRLGVLHPTSSRALEVTILTGLRRSAVVSAKHSDIKKGVWTVRPELLKRKVPIKIVLTPRLKELLTSDDPIWVFPQPRKTKSGERSHISDSAVGKATWELPSAPSATECKRSMERFLTDYDHEFRTDLLVDAGAAARDGGDDHLVSTGGKAWQHREELLEVWGKAIEKEVADILPVLDAEALRQTVVGARPKSL